VRLLNKFSCIALCLAISAVAGAKAPTDVPAEHAARKAVLAMVALNVMPAKDGKFNGGRSVSRAELAQILHRYVRVLEEGRNKDFPVKAMRKHTTGTGWETRTITRYEVAEVLYRVGGAIAARPPMKTGKADLSVAIPIAKSAQSVPKGSPARASVEQLAKRRMVWKRLHQFDEHTGEYQNVEPSVLLTPDQRPVTGAQFADVIAQLVEGYYDTRTGEPQNHEGTKKKPLTLKRQ
jgi:hypothetical protein